MSFFRTTHRPAPGGRLLWSLAALALAVSGCSEDADEATRDAGTDAHHAHLDHGAEAGSDAQTDAQVDGGPGAAACADAVDTLVRCMRAICADDYLSPDGLVFSCEDDPQSFFEAYPAGGDCAVYQPILCDQDTINQYCECPNRPGPEDYTIGASCTADADCLAARNVPICLGGTEAGDNPAGFAGGYCSALDCRLNACGPGAECYGLLPGGQRACLKHCDTGAPACREGYTCSRVRDGNTVGVCLPTGGETTLAPE